MNLLKTNNNIYDVPASCLVGTLNTLTFIKKMNKKINIPKDLRVIMWKYYCWVVYESKNQNRFFISYHYESGFFQGNVALELNNKEILEFQKSPDDFLENQSKQVSKNYSLYSKERNIEEFHKVVDSKRLIEDWRGQA